MIETKKIFEEYMKERAKKDYIWNTSKTITTHNHDNKKYCMTIEVKEIPKIQNEIQE